MRFLIERWRTVLLCGLAALSVSGCATGPARLPIVAPDTQQGQVEDVLIATSRSRSDDPERYYGSGRSQTLSFANAGVWVPADREPGSVPYPGARFDARTDFALTGYETLSGSSEFQTALNAQLRALPEDERAVVVFVHGFNTPFSNGLYLNAQILADFDLSGVAVHFSWPSAGRPSAYLYDRDSVAFSRDGFAETLRLISQSDAASINVIAHSMGALLTMETLRQFSTAGEEDVLARLDFVILASPDIDSDVFHEQVRSISPLPNQLAVFVSQRDRILALSNALRGEPAARVGLGENRAELTDLGVTVVDLTSLRDGGYSNHNAFSHSPTLMRMVRSGVFASAILGEPTRIRDRKIGTLSDLAASIIYLPARVLGQR